MKQNLLSFYFLFLFTAVSLLGKAQDEVTNSGGASKIRHDPGLIPWTTAPATSIWENVKTPDDLAIGVPYAEATLAQNQVTDFLILSDFQFNIPLNYKIVQISVRVFGNGTINNSITVPYLALINTTPGGFALRPGNAPSGVSTVRVGFTGFETDPQKSEQVYGSPIATQESTWNTSITPTQINDPTFGIAIQFKNQNAAVSTVKMDYISIKLFLQQQIPLPVSLTGLNASYKNQSTFLTWGTESEVAFEKFEVQRSATGSNFTTIATVIPNGGVGVRSQYGYTDNLSNQAGNTFYYRLRLTDKNGMGAFSKTILIRKDAKAVRKLSMYPNPVSNGQAFVRMNAPKSGDIELRVLNLSGQSVIRQKTRVFEGDNTTTLDLLSQLKGGVYVLQMINMLGEKETAKFTVVK